MIDEGDNHRTGIAPNLFKPPGNRNTHFALRIIIDGKSHSMIAEMAANIFCAMAYDNHDVFNVRVAKIDNTASDNGLIAEWKERLAVPPTARASRGQANCDHLLHVEKIN